MTLPSKAAWASLGKVCWRAVAMRDEVGRNSLSESSARVGCTAEPDHRIDDDQLGRNFDVFRMEEEERRSTGCSLLRRTRYGRTATRKTFLECARSSSACCAGADAKSLPKHDRNHLHCRAESTEASMCDAVGTQNIEAAHAPNSHMSGWHVAHAWATLEAMGLQRRKRIAESRDGERQLTVERADFPDMVLYMRKPWGAGRSQHLYDVSVFRGQRRHLCRGGAREGGWDVDSEDIKEVGRRINLR